MARCPAVLLLAALALANVETGTAACESGDQWQCGNGHCIDAFNRCNGGKPDCSDSSDEEDDMCDKEVPSIRMQAGQVTTVRVDHKDGHHGIEFHLCGGTTWNGFTIVTACSSLLLSGHTKDGALWFNAETACNARGGNCSYHDMGTPEGAGNLPGGQFVFKAERRSGELAVWLAGHKDKAATVPVEECSDLLRVRPRYWSSDLPVQFNGCASEEAGRTTLRFTTAPMSPLYLGYKTYYVINNTKSNWHLALQSCIKRGWDLASIDSPLEQDMLANFLNSNGNADHWFWLSGTDQGSEGEFHWMRRGEPNHPINFTHWDAGQPDNHNGNENCVNLCGVPNGNTWNDYPCSSHLHYVCQELKRNCCSMCKK